MSYSTLENFFKIVLISFLLAHISPLSAATRTTPVKSAPAGADYTRALAAADRFLQAWQGGDVEAGTVMLTAHAKNKTNHDELEQLFSNSAPTAYEIDRGKFLRRGRYEFPIVLMSASAKRPRRRLASIVVLNTGHDGWAVDKLP